MGEKASAAPSSGASVPSKSSNASAQPTTSSTPSDPSTKPPQGSTKLQINLKAVKKPEKKEPPGEKIPPVKLNPVPGGKPEEGKVLKEVSMIPIQRVKSQSKEGASAPKKNDGKGRKNSSEKPPNIPGQ